MFTHDVGSAANTSDSRGTQSSDGESSLSKSLDTVSLLENGLLSYDPPESQWPSRGILNFYSLFWET
jgi:hypothetical protein